MILFSYDGLEILNDLENFESYLELSHDEEAIQFYMVYMDWKSSYPFLFFLEKFVNEMMDAKEFHEKVIGLCLKQISTCESVREELSSKKLKDFQPDRRSTGFGRLVSFLLAECDHFCEDDQNDEFLILLELNRMTSVS